MDNSFLKELKQEEQQIKEQQPKYEDIPKNYTINNNELCRLVPKKQGGEVVGYSEIPLSREIPRIQSSMSDVENDDSYHILEFENIRKGEKREIQVPTKTISHARELVELSAKGVSVNSNNATHLVEYFDRYQAELDVKHRKIVTRLGHIKGRFVHPSIPSDFEIITTEAEYKKIVESMKPEGTLKEYQEHVFNCIKDSDTALFMFFSALSSMLCEEYKIEPFIVDLSGQTSMGKTALLRAVATIYGQYDNLVMTWDTTEINVNRRAVFMNSFPLLIDDTQKAKYKNLVSNVTYQFSSGQERGRANLTGIEETKQWRNVMISTGENSITSFGDNKGGQAARTITVERAPFDINPEDTTFFKELYKGIEKYHGTLATAFYKQFTSNKRYYSRAFEDFEHDFRTRKDNDVMQRLGRLFAVVKVAGLVLDEIEGFENDYDRVCDTIFKDMAENNKSVDKPREILDTILAELDAKRAYLISKENNYERGEMIGGIKPEFVGILPAYLNKELGHEKNAIIKEWKKRGWLVVDNSGKRFQKSVKIGGTTRKMYCIQSFITRELGYDFQTGITGRDIPTADEHTATRI